jgi:hypothetical protein
MLGGKLTATLALLAIGPASTPVETPAMPALDFAQAVGICRVGFLEQLQGKAPARARALFADLPEAHKPAVAAVCASYQIGQQDLASFIEAARAAAAPPPAAEAEAEAEDNSI